MCHLVKFYHQLYTSVSHTASLACSSWALHLVESCASLGSRDLCESGRFSLKKGTPLRSLAARATGTYFLLCCWGHAWFWWWPSTQDAGSPHLTCSIFFILLDAVSLSHLRMAPLQPRTDFRPIRRCISIFVWWAGRSSSWWVASVGGDLSTICDYDAIRVWS